jgi:transposase
MRASTLFRDLVKLSPPWRIERILSFPQEKRVEILLNHLPGKQFPCPECGIRLPVRDHVPQRSWRHLDSGPFVTVLRARLPRVACAFHGIRQVRVPWASSHIRYTSAFEQWAIDVLRETDVLGATRLLRISWDEAWHLMERAVDRGRRRKQRTVVPHLGIDEKAIAKGHTYLTLICDLDRGTVEYLADDRKTSSLDEYYQSLSEEQLAGIEAVAMDMWEPFISSTKEYVPGADEKIVFDRYHIMMYMGKAVDAVRKRENRLLQAEGDTTLKGTKYLWLYGQENIPEQHLEWFAGLKKLHLKTGRAWAIKEYLRELWHYQRRGWAERHWQRWYSWAIRSRLPEVRSVARTMRNHLPNILTYFAHRITNAVSEGVNSKIQGIKKTPVGFAIAIISRQQFTFTAEAWNSTQPQTNERANSSNLQ